MGDWAAFSDVDCWHHSSQSLTLTSPTSRGTYFQVHLLTTDLPYKTVPGVVDSRAGSPWVFTDPSAHGTASPGWDVGWTDDAGQEDAGREVTPTASSPQGKTRPAGVP